MKQFIRKAFWFLVAFCVVQIVLNGLVLDGVGHPYAHNKRFATKYVHYKQSENQYNTLFIGSSRIYREINPAIIDSTLAEFNFKSYNLGASATFIPESYYLFERLLENKSYDASPRYVFLELNEITSIKFVNWFTPQSYYYLDSRYLSLVWNQAMNDPDMNLWMKAERIYPYLQGYLLKLLFILPRWNIKPDSSVFLGPHQNGYYPLELELQQNETPRLLERRTMFLEDTSVIQVRIKVQQKTPVDEISQTYIDYLNSLIDKADRHGVKLYYLIPPKLKNYVAVKEIMNRIRDERVVDMGSFETYPDLYQAKYWFDQGHFNMPGADLYSGYLAKAIREKLVGKG